MHKTTTRRAKENKDKDKHLHPAKSNLFLTFLVFLLPVPLHTFCSFFLHHPHTHPSTSSLLHFFFLSKKWKKALFLFSFPVSAPIFPSYIINISHSSPSFLPSSAAFVRVGSSLEVFFPSLLAVCISLPASPRGGVGKEEEEQTYLVRGASFSCPFLSSPCSFSYFSISYSHFITQHS